MELIFALYAAVGVAVYFVPSLVAFYTKKRNRRAILVVNLLLGWTFLGWVGSLVWAIVAPREQRR